MNMNYDSDEDECHNNSRNKRSRKNGVDWKSKEIGRQVGIRDHFAFLARTATSHEGGDWIKGRRYVGKQSIYTEYTCGMRTAGCKVRLRVDEHTHVDISGRTTVTFVVAQDANITTEVASLAGCTRV